VHLQERARERRRATQEGANRSQHRGQLIVGLNLVGATLEDAAYGPIAAVASIEGSLAGALESFSSEAIDQTQDALRLAEMMQRVIDQQFANELVRGWPDRLGLPQARLG
jgi:hypothetical protein